MPECFVSLSSAFDFAPALSGHAFVLVFACALPVPVAAIFGGK